MPKTPKKPNQPPTEYIPVIDKQLRWIRCRTIAEAMYHSKMTDIEISKELTRLANLLEYQN